MSDTIPINPGWQERHEAVWQFEPHPPFRGIPYPYAPRHRMRRAAQSQKETHVWSMVAGGLAIIGSLLVSRKLLKRRKRRNQQKNAE